MVLQVVLHRCYLNLRFPAVAESIAPLLQHDRHDREAERQAELERMLAEFHVAYGHYMQAKTVGPRVSIEEAWRRLCAGMVVIFDGEFYPWPAA